jgi:hypothetical protein
MRRLVLVAVCERSRRRDFLVVVVTNVIVNHYYFGASVGDHFQVFLSHASRDKPFVRLVAERLQRDGITFFLDEANLVPGMPWQVALEQALRASDSCAVFIGDERLGPYHTLEMRAALSEQAEVNRGFRVIPVLLPGQTRPSERELPAFLKQLTWVEFTTDPDHDDSAYRRLKAGIEGKEPGFVADGRNERPTVHPVATPRQPSVPGSAALKIWREKLAYLEEQEAIAADAAQKFALRKQIEEATTKIQQLGG